MKAIVNTKLIMEDGIIFDGALTFADGKIVACGPTDEVEIPADAERIDAHGLYTAPGLVDIHNHGGGGKQFWQDPLLCCRHFIKHGQTTILPTLYPSIGVADTLDAINRIRELSHEGVGRVMRYGLYMEGPYMNGKGGDLSNIKWTGPIIPEEYKPLVETAGDFVRVWCFDPEREGVEPFVQYAKEVNPNVIFSIGHTNTTADVCRRFKKYGVRNQTHHGDAGTAKGRAQGTIGAGTDEFALYDPEIYAELICDRRGIHVVPDRVKLLVKVKGVERVILITDSFGPEQQYMPGPGIAYGEDLYYDKDGWLTGSCLTQDAACRNLMRHSGYGLCHAIRMATQNPARMLGLDSEIGSLAPGKRADLILIDDVINVNRVFFAGEDIDELVK